VCVCRDFGAWIPTLQTHMNRWERNKNQKYKPAKQGAKHNRTTKLNNTNWKQPQHQQEKQSSGLRFHSYNMHEPLAFRFRNHLHDESWTCSIISSTVVILLLKIHALIPTIPNHPHNCVPHQDQPCTSNLVSRTPCKHR
jgi:hypothetical protein